LYVSKLHFFALLNIQNGATWGATYHNYKIVSKYENHKIAFDIPFLFHVLWLFSFSVKVASCRITFCINNKQGPETSFNELSRCLIPNLFINLLIGLRVHFRLQRKKMIMYLLRPQNFHKHMAKSVNIRFYLCIKVRTMT